MIKIPLTRGYVALIDDEDAALARHKWNAVVSPGTRKLVYARRALPRVGSKCHKVWLHREILGAPADMDVDHINGDPLDNRRENLRLATRRLNCANNRRKRGPTQYRGVSIEYGKYRAQGSAGKGVRIYLGAFDDAADAARAYDIFARREYGEFAQLNFPNEVPDEAAIEARRRKRKDWRPPPKTHCKHGHAMTSENTYRWNGRRQCRACGNRMAADKRARLRQAQEQDA